MKGFRYMAFQLGLTSSKYLDDTLREVSKYGVFLVRIFPHSDWIRRDTEYLSVFSPNAGKYRPEKTPYLDTFHAVIMQQIQNWSNRLHS